MVKLATKLGKLQVRYGKLSICEDCNPCGPSIPLGCYECDTPDTGLVFTVDVSISGYADFVDVPVAWDVSIYPSYKGLLQNCSTGTLRIWIACEGGLWVWYLIHTVYESHGPFPISLCTDPISGGTVTLGEPIENPDCGLSGVYDITIVIKP
jgi:hypothetical protein